MSGRVGERIKFAVAGSRNLPGGLATCAGCEERYVATGKVYCRDCERTNVDLESRRLAGESERLAARPKASAMYAAQKRTQLGVVAAPAPLAKSLLRFAAAVGLVLSAYVTLDWVVRMWVR